MSTANDPWGRVDADGTVYVRTAEGERVIGSWQAGSPEEALAFYRRKFEALNTEITLLEQRVTTTDLSPAQARASIERLRGALTDAHAIGDLGQLQARPMIVQVRQRLAWWTRLACWRSYFSRASLRWRSFFPATPVVLLASGVPPC